jgi:lysozyme family protein
VNHPDDPGGATNMGITHKTLAAARGVPSVTKEQVKMLTLREAASIYRRSYWLPIRGDDLPYGLDYAVFDFGVNSGVYRAVLKLQEELKARKLYDGRMFGVLGDKTLQAIAAVNDVNGLIEGYVARRLQFLKKLKGWSTFGKGWQRRVDDVLELALTMAAFKTTQNLNPSALRVSLTAAHPATSRTPARLR